jgi:small-conductance mechanosensitive channel
MFSDLTNDELMSVIDAVKWKRATIAKLTKASLRIGDNVNFTSSKTGQNVTGVVVKIAIKFVTVKTIQGAWRVPANMLSKIEDREFA